jgi:hypothetical protein
VSDDLDALLPRAEDNFHGHEGRECGEHRTAGFRAWCFDCSEWCSQEIPCVRCEIPSLRADYTAALDLIARLTEGWDAVPNIVPGRCHWQRDYDPPDPSDKIREPMSDREWRVYCDAAQRATHPGAAS